MGSEPANRSISNPAYEIAVVRRVRTSVNATIPSDHSLLAPSVEVSWRYPRSTGETSFTVGLNTHHHTPSSDSDSGVGASTREEFPGLFPSLVLFPAVTFLRYHFIPQSDSGYYYYYFKFCRIAVP